MRETQQTIYDDIPELEQVATGASGLIKSYVLRTTRIKTFQVEAVRSYYHDWAIPFAAKQVDLNRYYPSVQPLIIEIGFGMGTATEIIARERPQYNYLGIEVFLGGFTKLLSQVGSQNLKNIRLMRHDAVEVLTTMVEDQSVDGFHIFFPDPWPKKRHHKRRLIQESFAALLASKLKRGGYIYCVTDWLEYALQMVEVFDNTAGLNNPSGGFCDPVAWRPETRFERKGVDQRHTISEIWVEKQ
jgi:tRNA (guanine-N7-)-methyltransferase